MEYEEKYGTLIHSDNTIAHTQVWTFDSQEQLLQFWLGIEEDKLQFTASLSSNTITRTVYVTVEEYLAQIHGEEE